MFETLESRCLMSVSTTIIPQAIATSSTTLTATYETGGLTARTDSFSGLADALQIIVKSSNPKLADDSQ